MTRTSIWPFKGIEHMTHDHRTHLFLHLFFSVPDASILDSLLCQHRPVIECFTVGIGPSRGSAKTGEFPPHHCFRPWSPGPREHISVSISLCGAATISSHRI